ncbi:MULTISPECIES: DUF4395 family protein [Bacillus]|uniref:DUF4395 family protein n=1 Tax=Bacillus TaxID=1386 RepID=UPI0034E9743C
MVSQSKSCYSTWKTFHKKTLSTYPQEKVAQVQFYQTIAVFMFRAFIVWFYIQFTIYWVCFYHYGCAFATFAANLGFCVGCFIRYQWKQYQYRRSLKN